MRKNPGGLFERYHCVRLELFPHTLCILCLFRSHSFSLFINRQLVRADSLSFLYPFLPSPSFFQRLSSFSSSSSSSSYSYSPFPRIRVSKAKRLAPVCDQRVLFSFFFHDDPSFMLRVCVGARGRRYRYTYGTTRIRPTVARVTRAGSRGWARTHLTAGRASTWPTSARAIKDGTSARSSSSTGRPTRTAPGSIWTSTVSTLFPLSPPNRRNRSKKLPIAFRPRWRPIVPSKVRNAASLNNRIWKNSILREESIDQTGEEKKRRRRKRTRFKRDNGTSFFREWNLSGKFLTEHGQVFFTSLLAPTGLVNILSRA